MYTICSWNFIVIKNLLFGGINEKQKSMPSYVMIDDVKIYKNEYIEAIENVNKFILENGRHPETITIYVKRRRK